MPARRSAGRRVGARRRRGLEDEILARGFIDADHARAVDPST
jgi:hypothetical protein